MKIDEFISHWAKDSSTGLFLPKRPGQPSRKPATKKSASLAFSDAFNRLSDDPRIYAAIQKRFFEALYGWAFFKMGAKRDQYVREACRDFVVLCASRLIATNQSVEQVINDVRFEFPLRLTKKRTAFTALLPELSLIAVEYEKVCDVAKSAKRNMRTAAQFRLNLREKLLQFAVDEKLEPMPQKQLEKLLEHYDRRTLPSRIAVDYVGRRRDLSGANIKKLLVVARNPDRISKLLGKDLKTRYLPPNSDAIRESFTASAPRSK